MFDIKILFGRLSFITTAPWAHPLSQHDDVIKWKHFPRYWPFVWGIHRSPVNSTHRPVTHSFDVYIDLLLNKWLSKQSRAGDLRRHRAHYDVIVMNNGNEPGLL